MVLRVKLVLISAGICCIFFLMNQLVIQPTSNDVKSSNLERKLNNSDENIPLDKKFIQNTDSITCPPIEASNTQNHTSIKRKLQSNNRSFSEHNLWYEQKLTKNTVNLPLSHYDIKTTKKILVWIYDWRGLPNPFDKEDRKDWFRNYGCPVWQCDVIPYDENRKNLNSSGIPVENFDAVIFHDIHWSGRKDLPTKRSPHQRYIFWSIEAPGRFSHLDKWQDSHDFFNWTMTYRWDSDIVVPYGYTRYLTGEEIRRKQIKKKNYAEGKKKMAAWFATNCYALNGRNEYIQKLKNHISLDIYGICGNKDLMCPQLKSKECREMMGRDYKFVIAFENSLCHDYVTEKMFYNPQFDIIPIVMDLHGNLDRFVPPKSFINALDFPTVEELADYLKILDKNDTLYNEYFWWKETYTFEYSLHLGEVNIYEKVARGYCDLCAKLHDPSEPESVVKNLTKWWNDDAKCKVLKFPTDSSSNSDTWVVHAFQAGNFGQ